MGKKKKEELDKQYEGFSGGMRANGYSDSAIEVLWNTLLPFADYAFNKAHSAGYGVLSYWTAFLKANYPAEYMSALLTSVRDSKDKMGMYLNECRRMGIQVLSPDVNSSFAAFTATGQDIRFGLGAVRNVGQNVVDGIAAARNEKGAFTSFGDFLKKVPAVVCNKRTVESLIKAGAFDTLGHTRRSLMEIFEEAVDTEIGVKKNEALGQVDLFGSLFDDVDAGVSVPDLAEWPKREKLALEREMLGMYVSDHPLAGREAQLARYSDVALAELKPAPETEPEVSDSTETESSTGSAQSQVFKDGQTVVVAGLITSVTHKVARASGKPYGVVEVEDFTDSIQVMLMGKTYGELAAGLQADQVVVVRGRLSQRDESFSLNAYSIDVLEAGGDTTAAPLQIRIQSATATRETLTELDRILRMYPGETEVYVTLVSPDDEKLFALPSKVQINHELYGELKVLLGRAAIGASAAVDAVAGNSSDEDVPPDEFEGPPEGGPDGHMFGE
jgi:DNA polymerase-3 subunit alpha